MLSKYYPYVGIGRLLCIAIFEVITCILGDVCMLYFMIFMHVIFLENFWRRDIYFLNKCFTRVF